MGTVKVAIPVESCAEKLSPIPCIFPAPDGTEMAWLLTPVLSAPVGSAVTDDGARVDSLGAVAAFALSVAPDNSLTLGGVDSCAFLTLVDSAAPYEGGDWETVFALSAALAA
jgi:hypothetical protein